MATGLLDRGAQGGDGHAAHIGPGELRPVARLAQHRLHERGEARVLGVVQVIGLGGGKEQPLHPPALHQPREKGVATGAERAEDIGHRAAGLLDRAGALMERAQQIDQHDLPVDPGEMRAEEGPHDLALVGLEAARHLRVQAAAPAPPASGRGAKVTTGAPSRSPGSRNRPGVQSA